VEFEQTYNPLAQNRAVYDDGYGTFLEVHKRMRRLYRRINREAT
jgi:hypothetical protein